MDSDYYGSDKYAKVLAADRALRLWDDIHDDADLWDENIWQERWRLVKAKERAVKEALERE